MNIIKISKTLLTTKDKNFLILLLPLLLISSALEIAGLSILPFFVSTISDLEETKKFLINLNFNDSIIEYFIKRSKIELIITLSIILGIILLLKNLVLIYIIFFENRVSFNIRLNLSKKLMNEYLNAPYNFHINSNSSNLIRNIAHEIKVTAEFYKNIIICLREVLLIASIAITLLIINFKITLASVLILILSTTIYTFFGKRFLYKKNKILYNLRGGIIKKIQEALISIKSTIILSRIDNILNEFTNIIKKKEKQEFIVNFFNKTPKIYFEIIVILIFLLFIFSFITLENNINFLLPMLALYGFSFIRLVPSFNNLSANYVMLKSQNISAVSIYSELIKIKKFEDIYQKNPSQKKINFKEKIKKNNFIIFKNISYKYINQKNFIFKNLNIKIPLGKIIFITGESGAGKTTFVDLLLGLLKPTSGSILIDNLDINKNIKEWRNVLGYVPQDVNLIDDTIIKNIALGLESKNISMKKILLSSKKANIYNFINKLDKKFYTNIGEYGSKISGGQKQRLGIARTLYDNPPIIVFDESTSSLDRKSEIQLMNDIKKISREKTIIFITHKLDNLKFADIILNVKSKKVFKVK